MTGFVFEVESGDLWVPEVTTDSQVCLRLDFGMTKYFFALIYYVNAQAGEDIRHTIPNEPTLAVSLPKVFFAMDPVESQPTRTQISSEKIRQASNARRMKATTVFQCPLETCSRTFTARHNLLYTQAPFPLPPHLL
jgi:hypothetical protein